MAKRCWGCNKENVSTLAWLSGDNVCVECKKNLTNPTVEANWVENSKNTQKVSQIDENTVHRQVSVFKENSKIVLGVFLTLFLLWMMFGGLLEDQSKYKEQNTVNIDCRQSNWSDSPYCNGDYENQLREQNYNEDTYYQNTVRGQ